MKTKSYILVVILLVLSFGIYFWILRSNTDAILAHRKDCQQRLQDFERQITVQSQGTLSGQPFDFFIAYSQKLNTCIGGVTFLTPTPQMRMQTFTIYDVLTNSVIQSFDGQTELIQNPTEYGQISDKKSQFLTAEQVAWEKYKAKLSDLSEGQIK